MKQPHIIIFNPDQWRGDAVGFLGTPGVQTPHLDALVANEAVAFTDAHCQHPICTPSRCSFMTGWYPHTFGHRDQIYMLRDPEAMILVQAQEAGYHTAWFGKNDLLPAESGLANFVDHYQPREIRPYPLYDQTGERRGNGPEDDRFYSFYTGLVEDRQDEPVSDDHDHQMMRDALAYIEGYQGDKPLFIYIALHNPHPPYGVEEPYYSMIDREAVDTPLPAPESWEGQPAIMREMYTRHGCGGWSEERWRELRATYYGMIARVDAHLGDLVSCLRDKGMWDDTALSIWSDHGDYAGDGAVVQKDSSSLRSCITNVPLVIKPPRGIDCVPGLRRTPTELIDATATLRRWAGIDTKHWPEFGICLQTSMADPDHVHREAAFSEGGHRVDDPRFTEKPANPGGLYWPTNSLAAEASPVNGKVALCRTTTHAYLRREFESDEFYDLQVDPAMRHNRIDDPIFATEVAVMKERLLDWYLRTGDIVPPLRNKREPPRVPRRET